MSKNISHNLLMEGEEIKGLKLFLPLFYLFFIGFDLIYYYIFPYFNNEQLGFSDKGLGFWYHSLLLPILFLSLYLIKNRVRVYIVKYLHLISFIIVDCINNFLIYYGTNSDFNNGNAVELVFILFSPLFINKKYFWFTVVGIIGKYVASGIVFQSLTVLTAIGLYSLLSILTYILLTRFCSNLASRLKLNDELRRSEQLATVGQLATSITHEIRNPLTSLKGLTQLQKKKYPEDNEYYRIMSNELERINSILDDLIVIGRPSMDYAKNNLQELIEYVIAIMNHHNGMEHPVAIIKELEEDLPEIECNAQHLKQVFINIIKNGMEAMPTGGKLFVKVKRLDDNYVQITVRDEGDGISKENLELLGDPFHTTKSEGTGLGLMVSFKIIEEHHGEIKYDSDEGKGTTVTIILPVHQY
ncbi:ATP-binding protein [Aquibacillus rhizosphaerae]|uniref:histidine kinase n=1 Tax=Aquibacillus rhizosphaerae TaxID=3051431 RepID=A0ABT7LBJ3_9BACI|nr:ATP-binding protein [Aquibacillus sp. LR5S19]MDL4843234.1 ATP-binding protein [Aquibacillus sp. LR5S19]